MSDLRAREAEPQPDWDGPIAELVEEDRVVGIVYTEDGSVMAEFYPDEDAEPWVFEVADLQRVLDTAAAMLGAGEDSASTPSVTGDAVDKLAGEFDAAAVLRGEEDEGFYPPLVAAAITERCETLGLAIANLEGFTNDGSGVLPVPGHRVDVADAHKGEAWLTFQASCNVQARALLERWAHRPGLIVAVEVIDQTGERFVL